METELAQSGKRINILDEYKQKFFQLPMVFFTNPIYKDLNNDSKIAYAILANRLSLSRWTTTSYGQNWIDEKGDIFFYYSNSSLSEILNVSPRKVTSIKKELKEANLLSAEKQGFNLPERCYLHYPTVRKEDIQAIDDLLRLEDEKLDPDFLSKRAKELEKKSTKKSSRLAKFASQQKTHENSDPSRLANFAMPDSQNLLPNYTESSNTNETNETNETEGSRSPYVKQSLSKENAAILKDVFYENHSSGYFSEKNLETLLLISNFDFPVAEELLKTANIAKKNIEKDLNFKLYLYKDYSEFQIEKDKLIEKSLRQFLYAKKMNKIENEFAYAYTCFYNTFAEIAELNLHILNKEDTNLNDEVINNINSKLEIILKKKKVN